MTAALRRSRFLTLSMLVLVLASVMSSPAQAGKKKPKGTNPELGGLYIPTGPVFRRGIVLGSLTQPVAPVTLTDRAVDEGQAPLPIHHTPPIESMHLHLLFEWASHLSEPSPPAGR